MTRYRANWRVPRKELTELQDWLRASKEQAGVIGTQPVKALTMNLRAAGTRNLCFQPKLASGCSIKNGTLPTLMNPR